MLDSFTLVRWHRLMLSILSGIIACATTLCVETVFHPADAVFPILEEILKALPVIWLIRRRHVIFVAEALCYGAAIGGGFAMLENVIYIVYNSDMTMFNAFLRGLGTALMHMGCTSLTAVLMLLMKNRILPLFFSMAVHALYNMFLLPVFLQIILTVIFFLIVFVCLSLYNERRIYRWLDNSITFDVKLLVAIKEGRLVDTRAGEYLLTVKEHFHPEVFFDVICFMQLYLELVIQGKSRLLLEQEGLAQPLTPEEKQVLDGKISEMKVLRRNIGIMGEHVLRPILRFNPEDISLFK